MTVNSIGDQARAFVMQTSSAKLKKTLDVLTQEVSSGKVADLGQRLQGNTRSLHDIEARIGMLDQYQRNAAEAASLTDAMQTVLGSVHDSTSELALAIMIEPTLPTELALSSRAKDAADVFSLVASKLNSNVAGQHLFSGLATDQRPLVPAEQILDQLEVLTATMTSAGSVVTAVNDWFDSTGPTGFLADAYQGTAGDQRQIRISESHSVQIDIDASSPEIRDLLKGLAMVALASRPVLASDYAERGALMKAGAELIVGNESELVAAMGRLGFGQKQISDGQASNSAASATLEIARNEILVADPFQTSVALSETQSHLEALYTVTARLSRLSLVEYLR